MAVFYRFRGCLVNISNVFCFCLFDVTISCITDIYTNLALGLTIHIVAEDGTGSSFFKDVG